MLGTCLEAAYQDRKNNNKGEQDLRNKRQKGICLNTVFETWTAAEVVIGRNAERMKVRRKGQDYAYGGSLSTEDCQD